MRSRFAQLHARTLLWHKFSLEAFLVMALSLVLFADSTSALRLQERSVYMNSTEAGATTFYRISWRYMSPDPVGSVEMLFCTDPIPYHPCVTPPGMTVAGAALTQQSGETGFSISAQSQNRIVLSRAALAPIDPKSNYTFDNIVNPTDPEFAFAIRLKTHASTDATGPQIDFGSMRAQVTPGVEIASQVPPMLIFCLAQEVAENCTSTNEVYYSDMGNLSATETLTAQSQMAIGTNASAGFSITANGAPMSAGTKIIEPLQTPTASQPGRNQFGINLVANTMPYVGKDPEGTWANAVASAEYSQPDRYKFANGDEVASSSSVSLMKKFTVSYIVNASESLAPGIYTTTINFIASGRF